MYNVCMNIDDFEKQIREKLNYAPAIGAKIKLDLGDDGVLFIDGTSSPPDISREDAEADTTFVCSLDVIKNIISGAQDPTMAFMTGKLKVQGSMGYALKLSSLLED